MIAKTLIRLAGLTAVLSVSACSLMPSANAPAELPLPAVQPHLDSGALVRPVAETVDTANGYYVLLRQGAGEDAHRLAQHLFRGARKTRPE